MTPAKWQEYGFYQAWPAVYTVIGNNLFIGPNTTPGWTYQLDYYAPFTGLNSGNPTNSLMALAPDIYLYGCLANAQAYIQALGGSQPSASTFQLWAQMYNNAKNWLETQDKRIREAGPVRVRAKPGYRV